MICLFGVDGVGKTTHAEKILKKYKDNNYIVKYRWFRFHHFISMLILAYGRLFGLTIYENIDGELIGRHEFYRSKVISFLYPWFLFIDTIPHFFFKIYLPLRSGEIVICDRFVYDTLVDIMVDIENFNLYNKLVGRLFIRLIPKKSKFILIDLDEDLIRSRRKDLINEPSLTLRRKLYQNIAEKFGIPIVNNDSNIEETQKKINKIIEEDIHE